MRVIYRSASRVRNISGWQPFLHDLTRNALAAILPFIKKHRVCSLILNVLSWLLVPILVLFVGVLVCLAVLHKYALQELCDWLMPDDELEVEWTNGDVVSFLLLVEGAPDRTAVKKRIAVIIEEKLNSNARSPKITKALISKMRFNVWRRQKHFHLDNHIFEMPDKWRNSRLTEDTLRLYVSEICSFRFHCSHPPWGIYLIPYTNIATLSQSHAVLVRFHSSLLREHALEDIFPCDTVDRDLKLFINKVFQSGLTNLQSGWLQKVHQKVAKCVPLVLASPRVFLSDLLFSHHSWSESSHKTRDQKVIFWSDEIPRDLIQKIKEASGTSSHVVLLSCVAGALRQYFQTTGIGIPEKVPCLLPFYEESMVSVKQDMPSAFQSLSLPLGRLDPVSRLHRLQSSVKKSKDFPVRFEMSSLATRFLPPMAVQLLSSLTTKKYPLVISNSFLSSEVRNFLNHPVTSVCCWNSFQIHNGLSLSLIHYADKICLSAMSKSSVQWPDLLVSCFQRQVYDLALALNVRIERKLSPPSSPKKMGRSLSVLQMY